jgi:hypothetical protein
LFDNSTCFSTAPFYIAADNEKKTIIVSIRGTLSATDVLTDINAVEDILETELFGNGHCHSGKKSVLLLLLKEVTQRWPPRLTTQQNLFTANGTKTR